MRAAGATSARERRLISKRVEDAETSTPWTGLCDRPYRCRHSAAVFQAAFGRSEDPTSAEPTDIRCPARGRGTGPQVGAQEVGRSATPPRAYSRERGPRRETQDPGQPANV